MHILDLEHIQVQPELGEVFVGLVGELFGELESVFVDFLGGEPGEDTAEVPFKGLFSDPLNL